MFAVKRVSEHESKEKNYMVVRKLCIGDSIDFIDYPKEQKLRIMDAEGENTVCSDKELSDIVIELLQVYAY